MALFMKQDFSPPLLSRRWVAVKLRPNMLIYSRDHIISILESGLLFREDCVEVEQEAPSELAIWTAAGGDWSKWMTRGELVTSGALILACLFISPPRSFQRSSLLRAAAYALVGVGVRQVHRGRCRGELRPLLERMRDYMTLARRAAAMCREYSALHAQIDSLSSVIESMHAMLCRQQSELAVLMARASSAILGNSPWLKDDVPWDAVSRDNTENLMKIHHAFLVVQSTLLKHIAMAHFLPPINAKKIYKNHNERIYWIHTTLLKHLTEEFQENYSALERMYRLLKNYGSNNEPKKPGTVIRDSWLYSEVHTDIARTNMELKLALSKCNSIDTFLDACSLDKQELNVDLLDKDIGDLIDNLTKCLTTAQNSQIRLKKLNRKLEGGDTTSFDDNSAHSVENVEILKIEDKEPETKDEVYYFIKTEDDNVTQTAEDVTTGPGRKEKENTKIVLNELKRKLLKREDLMRERERQALAKTMPELKSIPEFPRQIKLEDISQHKSNASKLKSKIKPRKQRTKKRFLWRHRKISQTIFNRIVKGILKEDFYSRDIEITGYICEVNTILLTVTKHYNLLIVTKWHKKVSEVVKELDVKNETKDIVPRYEEPSSSGTDSESDINDHQDILRKLRWHRTNRKPETISMATDADESLKPMEYRLGTGLAMASVLQINQHANRRNMAEEEFIGNGEVSDDSGHDDE
ncbi:uncharacterized protein [Battus philenor]|uniref:uncharacterized protein n=1 Tax=Battus philenor TaxID=42288 RepID=UPI0035CE9FE9